MISGLTWRFGKVWEDRPTGIERYGRIPLDGGTGEPATLLTIRRLRSESGGLLGVTPVQDATTLAWHAHLWVPGGVDRWLPLETLVLGRGSRPLPIAKAWDLCATYVGQALPLASVPSPAPRDLATVEDLLALMAQHRGGADKRWNKASPSVLLRIALESVWITQEEHDRGRERFGLRRLELTPAERTILDFLWFADGAPRHVDELCRVGRPRNAPRSIEALRAAIDGIRTKLGADAVKTVLGVGYSARVVDANGDDGLLRLGDVAVDPVTETVLRSGREIWFPGGHPYRLLALLLSNASRYVSKVTIIKEVWQGKEPTAEAFRESVARVRSYVGDSVVFDTGRNGSLRARARRAAEA